MTTKELALFSIKSAWAGTAIESICTIIVNCLSKNPKEIRTINETTLQEWTKHQYASDDLLEAALYLSGRNPHLLDRQYIFALNDEDDVSLSALEIMEAEDQGYMAHPETGERISNYEDYISFYFKPSKEAYSLVGDE